MKNTYAKLRVNSAEKALLEKYAKALDLTVSDYIRFCCLLYPPTVLKRKFEGNEELVIKPNSEE